MRNILFIVLFTIFGNYLQAQWYPVNSNTTENLNDIFFVDDLTGYCLGGGDIWGFLEGQGIILKTTDGGENWATIFEFDGNSLYNPVYIHFMNANKGIINTGKEIYKTNDGGMTFNEVAMDSIFPIPIDSTRVLELASISSVFHEEFGLVKLGYVDNPQTAPWVYTHWKTYDYGENWQQFSFTWGGYIYLLDSLNWFIADFGLYKTHDGGVTWDTSGTVWFDFPPLFQDTWHIHDTTGKGTVQTGYHQNFYTIISFEGGSVLNPDHSGYFSKIKYVDSLGFYLHKITEGTYLKRTIDDGQNFLSDIDTLDEINDIEFYDIHLGWACGENGLILKTTNGGGTVGINDPETVPNHFRLHPAYPNPFNPSATISFDIPPVETYNNTLLRVYDIKGRWVATLVDAPYKPGTHTVQWHPQNISSGLYIVQFKAGDKTFNQKITFIK